MVFDSFELIVKRDSNFDVISHIEKTVMPIDQLALICAADLVANDGVENYDKLAAKLSIPTDIMALLITNKTFSDLIDNKLAAATYMPHDRLKHILEVKEVATNRKKTTLNRSGEVITIDRNIKEVIDADKHLRMLQGRDDKQQANNIVNIRFEGLRHDELIDTDVIDVDFRQVTEAKELTEGELLGDKTREDRKAKARSILEARHIPKQGDDLPPERTLERLSNKQSLQSNPQGEFFYELDKSSRTQDAKDESYANSTQHTLRETEEIKKTLAVNDAAVYMPQTERDNRRRTDAANKGAKKQLDEERAKRGYQGRRESDLLAGKAKTAMHIPKSAKTIHTNEEWKDRLMRKVRLKRKMEEEGIKYDEDFLDKNLSEE